jgi:predicted ATPase
MKVLICGAFSTGKTTLVAAMRAAISQERWSSIDVIADVSRSCPLPLNKGQKSAATVWLLGRQLQREAECSVDEEALVLCDRGIPDLLSHYYWAVRHANAVKEIEFCAFATKWIETYDRIFLSRVNPDVLIEPDSLRVEDEIYRKELDQIIFDLLRDSNVEFHILPHDERERIQFIRQEIEHFSQAT